MLRLRSFMFDNVYLGADAQRRTPRIERMLHAVRPLRREPPLAVVEGASEEQRVIDWLAGMTDRFAIQLPTCRCRRASDGAIPRDSIDSLRDAVDMEDLVGTKTDLRRVGSRLTGLCPFHDERTPSFSVNVADKLFYCFGCHAKGDAIGFVEQTEGLDFRESVEFLAERYGVELELENEDPQAETRRRRKERLLALLDRAARFYASYLWESGEAAAAPSTWRVAACPRRPCVGSGSATRPAPGTVC